jgi:hypothetical protein
MGENNMKKKNYKLQEAKAGIWQVQGQPGLHSGNSVSKKQKFFFFLISCGMENVIGNDEVRSYNSSF